MKRDRIFNLILCCLVSLITFAQNDQKTEKNRSIADPTKTSKSISGNSRLNKKAPVIFLIGDSTVKNGQGNGDGDMWGWGDFFSWFFDRHRITVENRALGGRSSRTYFTEGLWDNVLPGIRKGDYVLIQMGHNDGGPLNTGRARASLRGIGEESETVIMEKDGKPETVYTYGHYMRTYIRQAKERGANVILLSLTPGNRWTEGKVNRANQTYGLWSKQLAEEEEVMFIDLNERTALKMEKLGESFCASLFMDGVHTNFDGAIMNCKSIVEGIIELSKCDLNKYIDKSSLARNFKTADKPLFRDPVFDGAADPIVIWNHKEKRWFMLYTNRRANAEGLEGVSWVHGTKIGVAESLDGGATWSYRGVCNIPYGSADYTFWAPDVVEFDGVYHMYLTIVPGTFKDWNQNRNIVHFTSRDLINWKFESKLALASNRVIDAGIVQTPHRTWRMYYNNERDKKSIYYAESKNLNKWEDKEKVIGDRSGEGPKVFQWKGKYFMVVDNWDGLAIYSSDNMESWTRQKNNILREPGIGLDDNTNGLHADVVVNQDRAYIFYFTHPGRSESKEDNYETRRSSIQVAELQYKNGEITCDRNRKCYINLLEPLWK